jgi:uncharacterized protein (DUF433 family)
MEKRKISARELIADVRAGMDDSALMARYNLSAQGLQSAFKKLVEANVMTQAPIAEPQYSPRERTL